MQMRDDKVRENLKRVLVDLLPGQNLSWVTLANACMSDMLRTSFFIACVVLHVHIRQAAIRTGQNVQVGFLSVNNDRFRPSSNHYTMFEILAHFVILDSHL